MVTSLKVVRDGPLENLWGLGGRGEVPKKYSRKYSCYGLKKKIHTRNFGNEKKFLRLENPPPPITFLMVRPLVQKTKKTENLYRHTIYSLYCYIEINFFEHQ